MSCRSINRLTNSGIMVPWYISILLNTAEAEDELGARKTDYVFGLLAPLYVIIF